MCLLLLVDGGLYFIMYTAITSRFVTLRCAASTVDEISTIVTEILAI